MGLTITDESLAQMIRDLAERKGVTPEEAVRAAVEREAVREPPQRPTLTPEQVQARFEALMAIARRAHALPVISDLTDDEILGYDDHGIPSR